MERILRFAVLAVSCLTLLWLSGCGGSPEGADSGADSEVDPALQAMEEREAKQAAEDAAAAEAAAAAERDRLANEAPSEVSKEDFQKGSKIKSDGYLSSVARARQQVPERMQLMMVTHALNLFYGLEGRYPKSQDEFMEKVVKANQIQLPELQEPYEYFYDVEKHELFKRPKPESFAEPAGTE